jgi:hypothetical protein
MATIFGVNNQPLMNQQHIVVVPINVDENYLCKNRESKLQDLNEILKQGWQIKIMNISSCGDKLVVCIEKTMVSFGF